MNKTPFKVAGEVALMTVSQRQMASAIGLSTTRINELINEGILIRDPSTEQGRLMLLESLTNYLQSRKTTSEGVNFWQERAAHEKAKRELAELKVAERRGELYEASTVEGVLLELLTDFKTKLLGIGHKLATRLEGMTAAQITDIIDAEINNCLEELSESVGAAEFAGDDTASLGTSAENDSKSMG